MQTGSVTISESLAVRLMSLLPEQTANDIMGELMSEASSTPGHMDEMAALASHLHVVRGLREHADVDLDRERGLYDKYIVQRTDGATGEGRKHERCRHFVLDVDHDPLAAPCLNLYADLCEVFYPLLARDLRKLTCCLP